MTIRLSLLLPLLAACLAVPLAHAAGVSVLDPQRRTLLEAGTDAQRSDVLVWLAQHGSQSDTPAVVPRLEDVDAKVRKLAEVTLWAMWLHSGDPEVDSWMTEAQQLMSGGELQAAIKVYGDVIQRLPDFAEGYNKRATAYYLLGDYDEAMQDIAAVLKRNPAHFGALSGAGLCLLKLDRPQEALFYFERALAVNPNLDTIREMAEALRSVSPRPRA